MICYVRLYMAFCAANVSNWTELKAHIDIIGTTTTQYGLSLRGPLACVSSYLSGVYFQGQGNYPAALQVFQSPLFALPDQNPTISSSVSQISRDFAILAAFNTILILRSPNSTEIDSILIAKLEKLCLTHPSTSLRSSFHLIKALTLDSTSNVLHIKKYLGYALNGAKEQANAQFMCIIFSIMCERFFSNVVGSQAEKSALAATVQAAKGGNVLWQSVAEGMLARCYDVQGKKEDAERAWVKAEYLAGIANGSIAKSS